MMKNPIFMGFVLAAAAPAFAQTTTTPADGTMSAPTSSDASTSAPTSASAPSSPSAAPAPTQAPADPASIIRTEFPIYDKDANGSLNKAEMSTWLKALKTASPGATPMATADETKWLDTSFTAADADKSASVSVTELTSYLTKGS